MSLRASAGWPGRPGGSEKALSEVRDGYETEPEAGVCGGKFFWQADCSNMVSCVHASVTDRTGYGSKEALGSLKLLRQSVVYIRRTKTLTNTNRTESD